MTFNTAIEEMLEKLDIDTDEVKKLIDVTNYDIDTLELIKQDLNTIMDVIPEAREKVLGKEKYHKQGSTVIYSFDSFEIDFLGWRKYCKGEAGRPADVLSSLLDAMKKADEDSEVRNFVIDVSCNGGGSEDIAVTILKPLALR